MRMCQAVSATWKRRHGRFTVPSSSPGNSWRHRAASSPRLGVGEWLWRRGMNKSLSKSFKWLDVCVHILSLEPTADGVDLDRE